MSPHVLQAHPTTSPPSPKTMKLTKREVWDGKMFSNFVSFFVCGFLWVSFYGAVCPSRKSPCITMCRARRERRLLLKSVAPSVGRHQLSCSTMPIVTSVPNFESDPVWFLAELRRWFCFGTSIVLGLPHDNASARPKGEMSCLWIYSALFIFLLLCLSIWDQISSFM